MANTTKSIPWDQALYDDIVKEINNSANSELMRTWTTSGTTIPINNVAASPYYTNGISAGAITTNNIRTPIDSADIVIGGKSLGAVITKIEERLAILDDPTPEKLAKFAALKNAYKQYKLLEKLCFEQGDAE